MPPLLGPGLAKKTAVKGHMYNLENSYLKRLDKAYLEQAAVLGGGGGISGGLYLEVSQCFYFFNLVSLKDRNFLMY